LYAWEMQGEPEVSGVVDRLLQFGRGRCAGEVEAEALARAVVSRRPELDQAIADAVEGWRLDRIGVVERNVLRLGLLELQDGRVPPRVAIDEGIRLARWFGGEKAPAFVNGVLDQLARRAGCL